MTKFTPPISERKTEELIDIVYAFSTNWQQEAINQAKKELAKRNVTKREQDDVVKKWKEKTGEYLKIERQKLENNETKSYEIWEMIILFIFGPILFFNPYLFNSHTLFTLRDENYFLKFKQRIIIFGLNFIAWFFYIQYDFEVSEKKEWKKLKK